VRRIALLAALVSLASCGDNRVILDVDIRSFVSEAILSASYGENPRIPAGLGEVSVALGPETILLPEGLDSVVRVVEGEIAVRAVFENATGSADASLALHFSEPGGDPFDAEPAVLLPIRLSHDFVTVVEETIPLDLETLNLFLNERVLMGLVIRLDASGSSQDLRGSERIEVLQARVVADPTIG